MREIPCFARSHCSSGSVQEREPAEGQASSVRHARMQCQRSCIFLELFNLCLDLISISLPGRPHVVIHPVVVLRVGQPVVVAKELHE
mmetsp:Transcript_20643/g.30775  ORF Transcript_20643/g.30775 Transcript_20643/m.30775 type:complete len:87 (+) Transcript_20643:86-346(+)